MGTFSDNATSKSESLRGAGRMDRVFSNARKALEYSRELMEKGKISKATFAKVEKKLKAKLAVKN